MKKNQLSFLILACMISLSPAYAIKTGSKNAQLDAILKTCSRQQSASKEQLQAIKQYQNDVLANLELTLAGIKEYSQKLNAQKKRLSDYSDHAKQLHSDVTRLQVALVASGSSEVKKLAETHIHAFEAQLEKLNDAAKDLGDMTSKPNEIPSAAGLKAAIDALKTELRALVAIDIDYANILKSIVNKATGKSVEIDDGGKDITSH